MKKVLITGGAGFIGSFVAEHLAKLGHEVYIIDAFTYAGFKCHIDEINANSDAAGGTIVSYQKADLRDYSRLEEFFHYFGPFDWVVHAAAESSVDRAIRGYEDFVSTNVMGSSNLFNILRKEKPERVINFGTDEVFGHFEEGEPGFFNETSAINPRNIYSASKAAQMMMAKAFNVTHEVPIITVCPSNCYGPRQHLEKLIPKIIDHTYRGEPMPIYGGGKNVREWLYVEDAAKGIAKLLEKGKIGDTYVMGSNDERDTGRIYENVTALMNNRGQRKDTMMITQKPRRPGDDFRYAVHPAKMNALGWKAETPFHEGLEKTVAWYLDSGWGRQFRALCRERS